MGNEQNQSETKAHPVDAVVIPCPRLEFRWVMHGISWRERECIYSLVLPLREFDIRRENEDGEAVYSEKTIEIGRTEVRGYRDGPPIFEDGTVETPFRDGAHARLDNEALGGQLPIVAVCGDVWNVVPA